MSKKILIAIFAMLFAISPTVNPPVSADQVALTAPHISDAVKAGQVAKATLADWPGAANVTFSWILNGKVLTSAKSTTLTITSAMNLKSLQLMQQATVNGQTQAEYSNRIVVGKTTISPSTAIAFGDGTKKTITVSSLQVYPATKAISYQWYRDGVVIKGATAKTLKLADKDPYSTFKVAVSAQASGFASNKFVTEEFTPDDQTKNYELLWSDEFNASAGSDLNTNNWVFQEGDGTAFKNAGWGNNEEQWYLGKQATQAADGTLNIDATRAGSTNYKCYYGACTWLSSKLVTYKKVGFLYGRLEARIRSSQGQGVWPAFWLLGANIDSRPWPGCGEIDIMELKGADSNTLWGTIHGPNGDVGTTKAMNSDISQWHTYAIDWTPNAITWFVDGVQYQRVTKWQYVGSSSPLVWVFDHEFYVILNLAMGGNFVGGPSDPALKTANLNIDYVRFFSIDGVGQVLRH